MRRPPSLTLRLTLLFGIAATIVLASFGWIIERSIEGHFRSEDIAELETIADSVSQTLSEQGVADVSTALEQRFSDILLGHESAVLYVSGKNGRVLFISPGEHDLSAIDHTAFDAQGNASLYIWRDARHTYRVLTQPLNKNTLAGAQADGPYTLSVAVAIDGHLRFLHKFRRTLWLMIVSGIVVMALMGWVAVRQGHAPLRNILTQIRRISGNELNARLSPETMPRELGDLADSFNDMLDRLQQAFAQLSNFSADIAHELRTPVTSLLTQSQVALSQSRSVEEYREILYSNIEEYEHLAKMIGDMLLLAKTENGQYELERTSIDLALEVQDLFEYYEPWAEERGVALSLTGGARVSADRPMLRRVLSNLLGNAIRHTPSGEAVTVYLESSAEKTVCIRVENPGPVIPAEHVPKLFDRFHRVDASRHRSGDGAGLGLAISKSIVDMHGGKIEASSTEKRTQFKISLPVRPA
jgi:two-component system, OmpR family, heavy metal sensor histidine kinase CusS